MYLTVLRKNISKDVRAKVKFQSQCSMFAMLEICNAKHMVKVGT